ncbi:MAG TPA: hypothetical protein VI233_10295 [Puia sp.]
MSDYPRNGKFERESRTTHSYIIRDEEVQAYLNNCTIPASAKNVELNGALKYTVDRPKDNSIRFIIAVDGESTTLPVNEGFPSSLLTFFQFGTLVIDIDDLEDMEKKPFVSPEDIKRLKEIKREKLVLPIKNISLQNGVDFRTVVRTAIQDFFRKDHAWNTPMLETLYWFLFETYNPKATRILHILSRCPHCGTPDIPLERDKMSRPEFSWECTHYLCKKEIFLTDAFKLFEQIDNETGAETIVGLLRNAVETFLILHTIRQLIELEDGLVSKFLFVKDGPLSFSRETAPMHRPMLNLLNYLGKTKNRINLVGVESGGPFIEHAKQIRDKIQPGEVFLLSNDHIYRHILVGNSRTQRYGETTYYGGKLIYKSLDKRIYVLSMLVDNPNTYYDKPELMDFSNVQEILFSVAKLRCDIYENALIPIAVLNKMISLSTQAGTRILEKFAKKTVKK